MAGGMEPTLSRRQCLQALGLGALSAGFAAAQRSRRPNVLMIAIDDLNDWIGALGGHPQSLTPNIDRLAQRGVLFRAAYCQAPSCNPSRASLLTGIRPSTSGVYQNNDVWRDAMPLATTLPQHFQLHGYEVLGGGKIFHGPMNEAQSWDYYYNPPGFLHPGDEPVNGLDMGHFDWGPLQVDDDQTADTMLAHWASDYLGKKRNRPFFLACGFYRPHLPWYAPEKYFEKFPEAATLLPKYLANDLDDVPASAPHNQRDHDNVTSSGQWKKAVASYLACIHYADTNVGRVLDALDAGPHAQNTIIVLWTDHGWHLGEKNHWRKFTLWEESCRVPLIFAGPGSRDNRTCDRPVELLDIYPTLIDLAGLPTRPELEGRTLRPLLEEPSAEWDKPALTSNGPDKTSVRTERWRYTKYPDGEELYDHWQDPQEWDNLASSPAYADVKAELAALLPRRTQTRKVLQYQDLPAEKKRLTELPPGRRHKPDPDSWTGLKPGPN
ncbi:MAG: sulfatase-like hydrolase/transferase [Acidobacteria bacterium]|nr:sulfatase-like hydrolase/transferase [Acidobacteriota bacterium]